jgi:hypothetical protein
MSTKPMTDEELAAEYDAQIAAAVATVATPEEADLNRLWKTLSVAPDDCMAARNSTKPIGR